MKKTGYFLMILLSLSFTLCGCQKQLTLDTELKNETAVSEDEKQDSAGDESPDYFFKVESQYGTEKETYRAIYDLARQELVVLMELEDTYEMDILSANGDVYTEPYYALTEQYLEAIIDASNENVRARKDEIMRDLLADHLFHLVYMEFLFDEENAKELFEEFRYEIELDIYAELFESHMLECALQLLDDVNSEEYTYAFENVKTFFAKAGLTETYQKELDYAQWKLGGTFCEYSNCDGWGKYAIEGMEGYYCQSHYYQLTNPEAETAKSERKHPDDPYNVYDYYDAEDFYYDYYDDFWEYEEAEEYFNEAWDKVE